MLVYRDQRRSAAPALLLTGLIDRARHLSPADSEAHDTTVSLLIELGELESAVADVLHPDADSIHPASAGFRRASIAAGHLMWQTWQCPVDAAATARCRDELVRALEDVFTRELPRSVQLGVAEGYAYYGLYPETYLESARRFAKSFTAGRPARAVCIGIRGIGTSLSAVVTSTLEEHGWPVESYTLRPRGHPFDRRIEMSAQLARALRAAAGAWFLLVDEGPGISGSSFAGGARAISELGVPDDRIVFFPSWDTDGSTLRSVQARERWPRHRRVTSGFDEVWLSSGRLLPGCPANRIRDLSAGAWRPLLIPLPDQYPAVQPQHERRKLLAGRRLFSFVGLGPRGRRALERARELATAGFSPAPARLRHGFIEREFVRGAPVTAAADPDLLDRMADYLAHLRAACPAEGDSAEALRTMMELNVEEALGGEGRTLLRRRLAEWGNPIGIPVALDARMLPHEWIRTPNGYLKVDAVDHHDDHFYPGPQDMAWDVAGCCLEFGLDREQRRHLIARYRERSGDREISRRLPFFATAYLAFRVGYASLAAEVLGDTAEGTRFRTLAGRYDEALRRELASARGSGWDG